MDTYTINKEIIINASPEIVFDILTDSDQIINYYPLTEVKSKWVVGSEVIYKGIVNNNEFTDYGKIEILSRPNEYKYTYWSDNHGTERIEENHLSISYKLSKNIHGTKLELEQGNIKSKEMYEIMNNNVWNYLLNNMKEHIEKTHNN